ncbi:hypothetical protein M5K25_026398 [Dendrobium thyrsiflorum]|uniref:Uncharacterized protein n=1 Tax=Dendrobium thyrsiflorum TaxID=117978 RepID=A0ABD0TXB3_DENTH
MGDSWSGKRDIDEKRHRATNDGDDGSGGSGVLSAWRQRQIRRQRHDTMGAIDTNQGHSVLCDFEFSTAQRVDCKGD